VGDVSSGLSLTPPQETKKTNPVQDRDQWTALVNTITNLRFHKMLGYLWVAAQLAATQERLSSMEGVRPRFGCLSPLVASTWPLRLPHAPEKMNSVYGLKVLERCGNSPNAISTVRSQCFTQSSAYKWIGLLKNGWKIFTDEERLNRPSTTTIERNTEQVHTLVLDNRRMAVRKNGRPTTHYSSQTSLHAVGFNNLDRIHCPFSVLEILVPETGSVFFFRHGGT
jgi:hypothetical protein